MKIIIAPDSFKGCMSARQACEAIERGVRGVLPDAECVLVPMADGGEGTVRRSWTPPAARCSRRR